MSKADERHILDSRHHRQPEYADTLPIGHMLADWLYGRAYVDNAGNYRYSRLAGERLRSKVTAWNREAKRRFRGAVDLHWSAMEALRGHSRPDYARDWNRDDEGENLFSEIQ